MTYGEASDFLRRGGCVDCGDDSDTKQQVLDFTELLGFEIGFRRRLAHKYRYVYYDGGCHKIHMWGSEYICERVISAAEFLGADAAELPEPPPLVDLYDWIA